MRVVAVAQAFKETLSASTVASALEAGIRKAGAIPRVLVASDGGDGLLEALGPHLIRRTEHRVLGPLGTPEAAEVGWFDNRTALVESRLICGLALIPPDNRDPLRSTTRGLGELLRQVHDAGAREAFVGLGGSAT